MNLRSQRSVAAPKRRGTGFTLIEVLITILVMAFGLLGFAMLQTMSLRFAQSANYRTQATNLAYEMLDQMRSNRQFAVQYTGATFAGGAPALCSRPIGTVDIAGNISRWQCQVRSVLGAGSSATVTFAPGDGIATVAITWGDERWNIDAAQRDKTFTVSTRL